jgi:hypothetical protein
VLSQKKLMIQEALAVCRKAGRQLTDVQGLERKKLEVAALLRNLQMTEEAGDDQVELERVMIGLAHALHWSNEAVWLRVFDGIWNGYEVFVGVARWSICRRRAR